MLIFHLFLEWKLHFRWLVSTAANFNYDQIVYEKYECQLNRIDLEPVQQFLLCWRRNNNNLQFLSGFLSK